MKIDDMREEYGPVIDRRKKAVSHNLLNVYKLLRTLEENSHPGPVSLAAAEAARWVEDYRGSL